MSTLDGSEVPPPQNSHPKFRELGIIYLFLPTMKTQRIDCFDAVPVSLHLPPNIFNKAAPCHTDTDYQEEVWLQCETNRGKRREESCQTRDS